MVEYHGPLMLLLNSHRITPNSELLHDASEMRLLIGLDGADYEEPGRPQNHPSEVLSAGAPDLRYSVLVLTGKFEVDRAS